MFFNRFSLGKVSVVVLTLSMYACSTQVDPVAYSPNTVVSSVSTLAPDPSKKTPDTSIASTPSNRSQIVWTPCEDGLLCSTLKVPYSYQEDISKYFTLNLQMRKADTDSSVGYLLVNPGGPGFGGTSMLRSASYYFSQDILDNFDLVAWDPRGTGESLPFVDCVDNFDKYFAVDLSPNSPADKKNLVDMAKEFNAGCVERSGDILKYISTVNSAGDMDSIRKALNVEKISYFGFSYGSELGAVWSTLYPQTVRAAVLDGASDPLANSLDKTMAQAAGFESQLDEFLKYCSNRPTCLFNNDTKSAQALDELFIKADLSPVSNTRVPITNGVLFMGIVTALYSSSQWDYLGKALYDLQLGDGTGILALYDSYFQYDAFTNTYGNELEAFFAISCLDDKGPNSVASVDANTAKFVKVAPRLGLGFSYGYFCALWPEESQPKLQVSGVGAGTIVVVGTTGDAATPLESSAKMAAALENGILVVVEADRHTGYNLNKCINKVVDTYLIKLTAPAPSTRC